MRPSMPVAGSLPAVAATGVVAAGRDADVATVRAGRLAVVRAVVVARAGAGWVVVVPGPSWGTWETSGTLEVCANASGAAPNPSRAEHSRARACRRERAGTRAALYGRGCPPGPRTGGRVVGSRA